MKHPIRTTLLLLAATLLGACAPRLIIPESIIERVESGEIIPDRIVFAVTGMLGDNWKPWHGNLQSSLAEDGVLVIRLQYASEPIGVILDYGRFDSAALLAKTADDLTRLPGITPTFAAIGFSQGGEVIIEAAHEMTRARLDRVVLHRTSETIFAHDTARLLGNRKIGEILSTHSPVDIHSWISPLGVGTVGQPGPAHRVRNLAQWYPHLPIHAQSTWLRLQHFLAGDAFRERRPVTPEAARRLAAWLRSVAN